MPCVTDDEGYPFDPEQAARDNRMRLARDYLKVRGWLAAARCERDVAYYTRHRDIAYKLLSEAMRAERTLHVDDKIIARDPTGDLTVMDWDAKHRTETEKRAARLAKEKR